MKRQLMIGNTTRNGVTKNKISEVGEGVGESICLGEERELTIKFLQHALDGTGAATAAHCHIEFVVVFCHRPEEKKGRIPI